MAISTLELSDQIATLRTRFNEVVSKVNTFRVATSNIILDLVSADPVSNSDMSNNTAVIFTSSTGELKIKAKIGESTPVTGTIGSVGVLDGGTY